MSVNLAKMIDAPEKQNVAASLIYAFFAFFSIPFILLLMSIGFRDAKNLSWFEIIFHALNAFVLVSLMREYLGFAWWNVRLNKDAVISTVAICAGLMLGVTMLWQAVSQFVPSTYAMTSAQSMLPIVESDLFVTPASVAASNPIFGTLCMVILTPLATSCVYYAAGFARAYNVRPWLGYVVVAVLAAFPRVCAGLTWWEPGTQMTLYFTQLPMHMICCWGYQKTDTIWTPIFSQAAANLIACVIAVSAVP